MLRKIIYISARRGCLTARNVLSIILIRPEGKNIYFRKLALRIETQILEEGRNILEELPQIGKAP